MTDDRIQALMRLLVSEGHVTPVGAHQVTQVWDAEQARLREHVAALDDAERQVEHLQERLAAKDDVAQHNFKMTQRIATELNDLRRFTSAVLDLAHQWDHIADAPEEDWPDDLIIGGSVWHAYVFAAHLRTLATKHGITP